MADEKDDKKKHDQLFDDLTGIEELAEGDEAYGDPITGISGELEEPPDIQTQSSIDLSGLLELGPDDLSTDSEEEEATETPGFGNPKEQEEIGLPQENAPEEMNFDSDISSSDESADEDSAPSEEENEAINEPSQTGSELPPVQSLAGSTLDYTNDGPGAEENAFDISSAEELSQLTQKEHKDDLSGIDEIKTAAGPDLSSLTSATNQNDVATEMLGGAPPPPPEAAKGQKENQTAPPPKKPKPTAPKQPEHKKEDFEPQSEAQVYEPMDVSPQENRRYDSGASRQPLENVKSFSEKSVAPSASASPSFPFSLKVTGKIKEEFKQRVLDFFGQEKMGISPLDLEPQFDTGKLLIPRISEYAATVLIQKLRDSGARIEIGPSDLIYATPETRADASDPVAKSQIPDKHWVYDPALASAADKIPLVASTDRHILDPKNNKEWKVVDAITATATLKSRLVEAKDSEEYKTLLDALELELKHKAFYKGANAVLDYKISLIPLHSPTEYKLTLQGAAVRVKKRKKPAPPLEK